MVLAGLKEVRRIFQKFRIDVTDKDRNTARLFYFRVTLWLRKLIEKIYT